MTAPPFPAPGRPASPVPRPGAGSKAPQGEPPPPVFGVDPRPAEVLGSALVKVGPGFCSVGTVLAARCAS